MKALEAEQGIKSRGGTDHDGPNHNDFIGISHVWRDMSQQPQAAGNNAVRYGKQHYQQGRRPNRLGMK
jgi:hypothetical protein